MVRVTQLGYLGLTVSKLDEWERFATAVLGLQLAGRTEDGALLLRMDEYHHRFIVSEGDDDDLAFAGWEVPDQPSLAALALQIKAGGIEVESGSAEEAARRGVADLIKFTDPSGTPMEAYYGPLISFENPFRSPRTISGFDTGTMGLGHIVLRVDDAQKSLGFYRDVLGMRISDFIDLKMRRGRPTDNIRLTFMHCNPRHHSIAFGAIPVPKRLLHFMLQVKSIDDVGSTLYAAQDGGAEISASLGRHTNDHMVSFYMRTPAGFEVEYGYGARTIDDSIWKVERHEAPSIWGHRGLAAPPRK
ncbi:MAG TPA: VOC family protein [Candidatus Binataceae bacterium]|jgi:biphenyl-2,3-diol 1,2-dioxygenase|nr:VOC family protein [Candidatus Binataceae bacterium]